MTWAIDVDGDVRSRIRHLHPGRKQAVKAALREVAQDPWVGKALQEELAGLYSYRLGTLRIVYAIDGARKRVHVVAFGPRRSIYEDLERATGRASRS